jgi:hypothetical protein
MCRKVGTSRRLPIRRAVSASASIWGKADTEQDALKNVVPKRLARSPKRPRVTKSAHMLAQLAIGLGEAAIVPPEHDTGSASNARIGYLQVGQQFICHSDVVYVA